MPNVCSGIRNRLKLDDLRVFETTLVTALSKPGFTVACERGEAHLSEIDDEDQDTFREIIDIHRARLRRIRPLSSPTVLSNDTTDEASSDLAGQPIFDAAPALREEREEERLPERPADRVQRWCNRLLDMSARNRLLNLPKSDRQLIELDCPDPAALEDVVADMRSGGNAKPLRFVSAPGLMDDDDPRNKALQQPVVPRLPLTSLPVEKPLDPATLPLQALVDLACRAIAIDCPDDDAIARMRDACGMSRMGQATRARFAVALNEARLMNDQHDKAGV